MEYSRPKKTLGQHFLTSEAAVAAVAHAADLSADDTVLEVGPGRGALTGALLERAGKVVAVEKDEALAEELTRTFAKEVSDGRLVVISGDILETSREDIGLRQGYFKVVANIPYYITGRFLRLLLAEGPQPSLAVLIVQKEVAERIARSAKESILSLSVKVFGEPSYVKTLKAGSFSPPPEVDSAIIKIDAISRKNLDRNHESIFFTLVKAGFGQKRKQLGGNLRTVVPEDVLLPTLATAGIDPTTRAEDVPIEKWLALTEEISKH